MQILIFYLLFGAHCVCVFAEKIKCHLRPAAVLFKCAWQSGQSDKYGMKWMCEIQWKLVNLVVLWEMSNAASWEGEKLHLVNCGCIKMSFCEVPPWHTHWTNVQNIFRKVSSSPLLGLFKSKKLFRNLTTSPVST